MSEEEMSGGTRPAPWKSLSCQNFFMLRMGSLMAGRVTGIEEEVVDLLCEVVIISAALLDAVDRCRWLIPTEAGTDSTSMLLSWDSNLP